MTGCFPYSLQPSYTSGSFVSKELEGEISTWRFIGASGFFSTFSDSLHIFVLGFCTKIHAKTHFRVCEVVWKHCWTVFLWNVCLGCPKTGSLLPECSDVFPGRFLPSGAFPLPLSLLSSSMAPGVREFGLSAPEAVEPANCRQNDFCLQHVAGAWALGLPFRRGQCSGDPTQSRAACASYMGIFVQVVPWECLTARRKHLTLDSDCLKNERTPIYVQMMVFCVYVRV